MTTRNPLQPPAVSNPLDPVNQQLTTVSSRAEWAHQQLSALLGDLQTMRATVTTAHGQAGKFSAANRALGDRVRALTAELEELRQAHGQMQDVNTELHDIAAQALEAHTVMEGELQVERTRSAQLRQAMAELEAQLDGEGSASGASAASNDDIDFLKAQNSALRDEVAHLEQELEAAKAAPPPAPLMPPPQLAAPAAGPNPADAKRIAELEAKLEAERRRTEDLQERLSRTVEERVKFSPVQRRVHQLVRDGERSSGSHNAEVISLRAAIGDLEDAMNKADVEMEHLKKTIAARDEEISWLSENAKPGSGGDQGEELAQAKRTVEAQKKEITRLRSKLLTR